MYFLSQSLFVYFCSVDDIASDLILRGIDIGIQTIHGDRYCPWVILTVPNDESLMFQI